MSTESSVVIDHEANHKGEHMRLCRTTFGRRRVSNEGRSFQVDWHDSSNVRGLGIFGGKARHPYALLSG